MENKKKNKIIYLYNVLIVLVIFLLTLVITKTDPFGNMALGKSDALSQYKPMLYNFIMAIKTGTLEAFSFNNALGNSFMFNFVYYLISPFNFIALLFNDANLMFLSVILLKLAVSSLTMTFYAKKRGASDLVASISVIAYCFSGWFLAYWYNIMWLDTFALFPLFQYGLEKILKENKCLIYIFVLALIYVTNFYQAFSVLVYNIVYFILYNFFYKKDKVLEKIKTLGFFLGSTLISFLLIYVYIYTLVIVKRQMGLGFSDLSDAGYIVSTIDFIKTIFYGTVNVTIEKVGHTFPNLCVNTFVLVGAISFFFNKKLSLRERVFAFVGLVLLVGCVFFKQLDYVMHMFHNVIGLTYRYSYIMSFLTVVLFIKNANNFELDRKKSYIILFILFIILFSCYKEIEFNIFVLNLIYLISIGILTFFYNKKICRGIIFILVLIQTLIVTTYNISFDVDKSSEGDKNNYLAEDVKYRVNSVTENDFLNQNMYYNQNVLYLYTSMSYNNVLNMVPSLGCFSGPNAMSCNYNDKFINMIFNVKNDYYLEKIFAVNEDILKLILDENNVKYSQEQVVKAMSGVEDIFDKKILIGKEENDNILFTSDKEYYLIDYVDDSGNINNFVQTYNEFSLKKERGINEVTIYTINEDKLKEVYEYLSKNQINYTYYSDSLMEGEIEVGENQIIFTSIPYDEAWHVYIDDKEIEAIKTMDDALLAIDCEKGKHKIKLEYKVDYKKPLIVSFITFIFLVVYSLYKMCKKKNKE